MAIGCTRSRCGRAWFCACVWKFGCGECSRCFRTTVWKSLCKQITTTHDVETDSCLNKHVEPQVGSNNNISCLCRVKTSRSAQSLLEVMIVKICFLLLFGQVAQAKAKVKAKTRAQPKRKATVSVKALDSCSCPSIDERLSWASKQFIHSVIPACNPFKWSCLEWQWPWLLFCYFLWLGQFLLFLIQLLLQLRLSDSVPSSSRMSKGLVAFPFQLPNMSMRDMLHSRVWAKTFADLLFVWWWSKLVFGFFFCPNITCFSWDFEMTFLPRKVTLWQAGQWDTADVCCVIMPATCQVSSKCASGPQMPASA